MPRKNYVVAAHILVLHVILKVAMHSSRQLLSRRLRRSCRDAHFAPCGRQYAARDSGMPVAGSAKMRRLIDSAVQYVLRVEVRHSLVE